MINLQLQSQPTMEVCASAKCRKAAAIAELTNVLNDIADFVLLDAGSVQQILSIYPDDPSQGIPLNTGDGVLSTGFQDKRVRTTS